MACRASGPGHVAALLALLLLLLLVWQPAAAAGALSVDEEGAVMRTLRQRVFDAGLTSAGWHGWHPRDNQPPCSWWRVQCSSASHVTVIDLQWSTVPSLHGGPSLLHVLMPELARFASLRQLTLNLYFAPTLAAIPPQWGQAGAFPALEQLEITVPTLKGSLPHVELGALPRLTSMHIEASNRVTLAPLVPTRQHTNTTATRASGSSHPRPPAVLQRGEGLQSPLPASWGASPDVLPALEELSLVLHVVPPLPASWARGFRRLRSLYIAAPPDAPLPATAGNVLPPEWAAGFPELRLLDLMRLGITGGIPSAWVERGFPMLAQLNFANLALTGPLPDRLLKAHPALMTLNLEQNRFTGTLPAAWAESQVLEGLSLRGNQLSGPLFPPAWLAPGAMPHLKFLVLNNNPGLTGPLPDRLPWPELTDLSLAGTHVESTAIPAGWCGSPNAGVFIIMDASDTSVGPELPPCAFKALPSLTLLSGNQTLSTGARSAAAAARPSKWRVSPAVAVAWLALAALGGTAGLALRSGRLRRQPIDELHQRAEDGETRLLIEERGSELSGLQPDVSRSQRGSTCSRQHRLESMLRSQLGSPHSRIELVHVGHLPAAMKHQLGSLRQGSRCTAEAAAAALPAPGMLPHSRLPAVREEQQHNSWGSFTSCGSGSRSGGDSSTAGFLESSTAGLPPSRQWGLETDSLRLAPGELELLSGPDGTLCLLGEGSSSAVFLGRLTGQEDVAVKVIELAPSCDSRHVWREVSLLRTCVHRRLVALLGVACQGQLMMLVMELMRGGDLHSALQRPATCDALRWAARGRQVALDVAEALAFLHSCGVQHADLKPSNVMLTDELRAKLTDLGVAQQLGSRSRQAVGGTTQYAAPEQLLGLPCTTKADVYSLGVLLTVLCTGRPLAARGQLCLPAAPADCPQQVLDLIQQCICPDPGRRPTAEEALRRLRAA